MDTINFPIDLIYSLFQPQLTKKKDVEKQQQQQQTEAHSHNKNGERTKIKFAGLTSFSGL